MSKSFPYYHQLDAMDCGPTCLRMVAKHYGKHYSLETLRQKSFIGREGVSMLGISIAAESIGFRTIGVHISFQQLCEAPLPCIVHWKQNHFVVVYDIKIRNNRGNSVVGANNYSPQQTRRYRLCGGPGTVENQIHRAGIPVGVDLQRVWQDGAKELGIRTTMKLFREGAYKSAKSRSIMSAFTELMNKRSKRLFLTDYIIML